MFKKKNGLEGLFEYFDYMTESFNTEGISPIELLVDLGKKLKDFPKELKTEQNRVPGCISNVYIDANLKDNKVYYQGSSDSFVIAGYVKILTDAFNGLYPSDIVSNTEKPIKDFLEKTNLPASLTQSRANALSNIYRLMIKKADSFYHT